MRTPLDYDTERPNRLEWAMAPPQDSPADGDDAGSDFQRRRDATVTAVLDALRRMVRESGRTQRSIEDDNGFRRGYLSQVLQGHITLTARHLIGILQSLECEPSAFFARLEEPWQAAPVLSEIRERLALHDRALAQLSRQGLVELPAWDVPQGEGHDRDGDDDGDDDGSEDESRASGR